jgi:hypothetical protein
MHLDTGEKILMTYYHHYTPFVYRIIKVIVATLPFYFLIFLFKSSLSFNTIFFLHLFVVSLFSLVTIYVTLVFWLDRLIVTNKRLIFIDWKYLSVKSEYETELKDIQAITSVERGIFAILPFFDYGKIEIKTSSNQTTIIFLEAPNPNGIKKFIQSLLIHHHN